MSAKDWLLSTGEIQYTLCEQFLSSPLPSNWNIYEAWCGQAWAKREAIQGSKLMSSVCTWWVGRSPWRTESWRAGPAQGKSTEVHPHPLTAHRETIPGGKWNSLPFLCSWVKNYSLIFYTSFSQTHLFLQYKIISANFREGEKWDTKPTYLAVIWQPWLR